MEGEKKITRSYSVRGKSGGGAKEVTDTDADEEEEEEGV